MQLFKYLALVFLALSLVGCGDQTLDTESSASGFKPGQVWSYKTRDGDDKSLLTILKIEDHPKFGMVAHIHVSDVKIPTKLVLDGEYKTIEHLPISVPYLKDSVVKLEETSGDIPKFKDGYDLWQNAVENGGAGVFEMSVAESVNHTAGALRSSIARSGIE